MGKQLTPAEEAQVLRAVIQEAHGVLKDLRAALKEGNTMATGLVTRFENIHAREVQHLEDHFRKEAERVVNSLNSSVAEARQFVGDLIMNGAAVFDRDTQSVTISWNPGGLVTERIPYKHRKQTPETPQ